MKRVGIAFGGGGARGIAHIGVLRVLRDCGDCAPRLATGTSAGSIVAALYAAGSSQEKIEAAVDDFDWYHRVIDLSDTMRNMIGPDRGGIVSNRKLGDAVNKLIGRRTFDDLEIDCAVVASDLVHLRRVVFTSRRVAARIDHSEMERFLLPPADGRPGCETVVVTDCGNIGLAVRASCAVPGVFQPVRFGEMRLVDGGVFNQVPVDVVRAMGSQVTIGVGLGMPYYPRRFSGIGSTIAAQIAAAGIAQHRRSLDLAEIGFTVEGIDGFSPLRARHHELLDLGQKSMEARMKRLRQLATAD